MLPVLFPFLSPYEDGDVHVRTWSGCYMHLLLKDSYFSINNSVETKNFRYLSNLGNAQFRITDTCIFPKWSLYPQ